MRLLKALLVLGAMCQASWVLGVEIYRYQNAQGVMVIDRLGVPPEFIANGYQVLNDQGRVIREVPPAPSLEERKRILKQQAQDKADQQLLRLYSSPEDIERARERKLKEHDHALDKAHSHLASLAIQKTNLEKQAAERERAGHDVPAQLLDQLASNAKQTQDVQAQLARLKRERKQEEAFYDDLRVRLERVLNAL